MVNERRQSKILETLVVFLFFAVGLLAIFEGYKIISNQLFKGIMLILY